MTALFLQHVPFEGSAGIAPILGRRGIPYSLCRVFNGEALPDHSAYDILFVMGGPMGVYDEREYPWLTRELQWLEGAAGAGKKIIGICLGAQLLARTLGARVKKNRVREIGWFPVWSVSEKSDIPLPKQFVPFHWHGDTFDLPKGAIHYARSDACENQAFLYGQTILALQFHLESTLEGIEDLFRHCGSECDEGSPYIQDVRTLLNSEHIRENLGIMERLIVWMMGDR